MEKIHINLNPSSEDKTKVFFQNITVYNSFLLFGAISLLIITLFVLSLILVRANVYKSYKRKWGRQEDKYKAIQAAKQEVTALRQEIEEFRKALPLQTNMAKIMEDIFSSLPKNIWFSSLSFKENFLNLRGYVVKWDEDEYVSLNKRFINSLRKKKYFSSQFGKINIKSAQNAKFNGVEVLEFNIECTK